MQNIFKYMNELLIKTIIFKYFLKILKIKINYDFVFDFSKKFTRNAFILSYFHMSSMCSQVFIAFRYFCDFFFIIINFYYFSYLFTKFKYKLYLIMQYFY